MNNVLTKDQTSIPNKYQKELFYLLALSSLFFYLFLMIFNKINRENLDLVFWIFLIQILFVLSYFLIKSSNNDYSNLIILFGAIFGFIMSFSQISLSDDIFRYLFNGYMLRNGINPYLYTPNSVKMEEIAFSYPFFDMINNTEVSDPYPPLMLLLTYLITLIIHNSLILWKLVTTSLVILLSIILRKILKNLDQNPNNTVLWSWNPLVILEFSHSGHNDIFAIIFLVLALILLFNKETNTKYSRFMAGLLWSLSIFLKLFPIILLIFFIKKLKFEGILGLFFGSIINFLTILLIGSYSSSGLVIFLRYWRFNGGLYELFNNGILFLINDIFSFDSKIAEIYSISRGLFIISIIISSLIITVHYFIRNQILEDSNAFLYSSYIFLVIFILTPVLHPWYITWILPIYIIMPNKPWKMSYFLLTITVLYSYYFYSCSCNDIIILLIEYVPVYFLLLYELVIFMRRFKKTKGITWP